MLQNVDKQTRRRRGWRWKRRICMYVYHHYHSRNTLYWLFDHNKDRKWRGSSIDGSIATTNSTSVIMYYRHQFLLVFKYRNSNTRSHITSCSVCFILCIYWIRFVFCCIILVLRNGNNNVATIELGTTYSNLFLRRATRPDAERNGKGNLRLVARPYRRQLSTVYSTRLWNISVLKWP